MPFFQAIDPTLAGQIDANGINQYASCGPYYFASRTPGRSITLKRNPYYKGGRTANADTIQVNIGNDVAVEYQNVEKGTSDYASGGIPATEWKNVVTKYGLNKKDGRVQVRPQLDIRYVALNHSRPLFKNNPQPGEGGQLGRRPPGLLGPGRLSVRQANGPDPAAGDARLQAAGDLSAEGHGQHDQAGAKKLAAGNLRGGKAVLWAANAGTAPLQAQLIQYNLKQIGHRRGDQAPAPRAAVHERGEPADGDFDMTVERWGADYADPYDFINILLDGNQVTNPQHNNYAYFNVAKYNKQMTAASLLTGPKRGAAYAALDGNMMRDEPAVGAARQLERPDLPVGTRGLRHDQRGHGDGTAAERALPQVAGEQDGEGRTGGRPSPSTDDTDDVPLHHQTTSLGLCPLHRSDADHLRPLLPAPGRPGATRRGQVGDRRGCRARLAPARPRPAGARAVRPLPQAARRRPLARPLLREPAHVNEMVGEAIPVTTALVLGGAVLWMLIALPIGILSALRPRSLLDRGAMIFILVGISAPVVWIGLLLQYFVGFKWGLTPNAGYCDVIDPPAGASCGGPGDWAYHMILPWVTFAILFAASYARMIRANVMDTLGEDYVRTARAKGAPENVVIRRHVLRNALLPVVTMLGLDIGVALGGAIFTEAIFNLPGLGRLALNSVLNLDLPTMQGVVVFATLAIILLNLVVDLVYATIDPRIRLA